jgi:tellurite methyltransferase
MNKISAVEFFNREYLAHPRYWWLGENRYSIDLKHHLPFHAQLIKIAKKHKTGRVLDIGTGEGADAIRLAILGYEVDAVDVSAIALEKTESFAKSQGVKLNLFNESIDQFTFETTYDIIICNGLLHYVGDKTNLLDKMCAATTKGGYNVISLFSTATPIPDYHQCVNIYPDDENGIITRRFKTWKKSYLSFDRNRPERSHPTPTPHSHSYIKLIAQKPI